MLKKLYYRNDKIYINASNEKISNYITMHHKEIMYNYRNDRMYQNTPERLKRCSCFLHCSTD